MPLRRVAAIRAMRRDADATLQPLRYCHYAITRHADAVSRRCAWRYYAMRCRRYMLFTYLLLLRCRFADYTQRYARLLICAMIR